MTKEEFVVKSQRLADEFGALLDEFLKDKKHLYASTSAVAPGNFILAEITVSYMNDNEDDKENLQKTLTSIEVRGNLEKVHHTRFHCTDDIWENRDAQN